MSWTVVAKVRHGRHRATASATGMGTDGTLMDAYGNVVGEWAWRP